MKNLNYSVRGSLWCEDDRVGDVNRVCRVSVIVSTYNLEGLVPLAIRSVLAQNYSDYEVVIVDDASTDSSWEKVIDAVRNYEGFKGVRVKCLRNPTNLGIAGTFNRLMKESCGELCVWHCGDDVAHLDRVSKIVKCWDAAKVMYPDLVCASTEANRVGQLENRDFVGEDVVPSWTVYSSREVFDRRIPLLGAAAAYSREQYDFFGPIDPAAQAEDSTMHIRTKLRGSFLFIHEPLLEYHCIGGASTSFKKKSLIAIRKSVKQWSHTYLQAQKDLLRCKDLISKSRYALYEEWFNSRLVCLDLQLRMMSDSVQERYAAVKSWLKFVKKDKSAIPWIVFVLPHRIVDCICSMRCLVGNVKRSALTKLGRG